MNNEALEPSPLPGATAPVGERIFKSAFWLFAGTVISNMLALAAAVITARLLERTGVGELGIINSTIGMGGSLAGLGLGLTATRYVAQWRSREPARAGNIVFMTLLAGIASSSLIMLLLYALAPHLAAGTLKAPHLTSLLRLASLQLVFLVVSGICAGALAGLESFRTTTLAGTLQGLFSCLAMIILVILAGLAGVVTASVLAAAAGMVLNLYFLLREFKRNGIPFSCEIEVRDLPVLWRFSLPAFVSGIVVSPAMWAANALLVRQPDGYGELGLLNITLQWRSLLALLPTIFASAALPLLSRESGREGENQAFPSIMKLLQELSILSLVPATVLLIMTSDLVLGLYGRSFTGGTAVFIVMLVGFAAFAFSGAAGAAMQAGGYMWFGAAANLLWGGTYVLFSALLVGRLHAMALAASFALAYLLLMVVLYLYLFNRRVISRELLMQAFASVAVIALAAGIAFSVDARLRLLLAAPAVIASIAACLLLGVLPLLRQMPRSAVACMPPSLRRHFFPLVRDKQGVQ